MDEIDVKKHAAGQPLRKRDREGRESESVWVQYPITASVIQTFVNVKLIPLLWKNALIFPKLKLNALMLASSFLLPSCSPLFPCVRFSVVVTCERQFVNDNEKPNQESRVIIKTP